MRRMIERLVNVNGWSKYSETDVANAPSSPAAGAWRESSAVWDDAAAAGETGGTPDRAEPAAVRSTLIRVSHKKVPPTTYIFTA